MSSDVSAHAAGGGHAAGHDAHGDHPTTGFYWMIGIILAVLTFVEVAVYYIEAFEPVEVPLLVVLSTAKVILVMMYFMHLKFDSRVFTWVLLAGVVLATFMVSAMVVIYNFIPNMGMPVPGS
jgi:cytochrome c oxidase subunit IV